ncbi:helix-turn-helix transcriptional regulator [Roseomonas sp. 18066]|uniref:helix-turn-helix transcriptional regulator n=1 Tax=Roseomonas sp. 18066 TaxID=2681412 RepID=UPI00135A9BA1|nr:helix-turn-helix transcriptional regulator [Roseomonas sp. 18066]
MSEIDALVDRIYEAALLPERWEPTLEALRERSDSASAALLLMRLDQPPRHRGTALVQPALRQFCESDAWRSNLRVSRLAARGDPGFLLADDCLSEREKDGDWVEQTLKRLGLGFQVGMMIPMPTGEFVTFTLERWRQAGPHPPPMRRLIDALRPHLARAGLMAARLGLERAQAAVETLQTLGLPAAVVAPGERLVAANAGFLQSTAILALARDRIALQGSAADAEFRRILAATLSAGGVASRSLPLRDREGLASVVHLLPLRGAARDLFTGARLLLVITGIGPLRAPDGALLTSLFDLTPAEIRLVRGLVAGHTLKTIAEQGPVALSTLRTQLVSVFRKTSTARQSELLALIASLSVMQR